MEVAATGGVLNARKLGLWLKRYRDRIVNHLRLTSVADRHAKVQTWWLETVSP